MNGFIARADLATAELRARTTAIPVSAVARYDALAPVDPGGLLATARCW